MLSEDISLDDPLDLAFVKHVYGFIALHRPHHTVRPADGGWHRRLTR